MFGIDLVNDFFSYIGVYFSGGEEYRRDWKEWRVMGELPSCQDTECFADDGGQVLENLQKLKNKIAKEDSEIRRRLELVLSEESPVVKAENIDSHPIATKTNDEVSEQKESQPKSESIATNDDYDTLLNKLSGLILELDGYGIRLETDEAKDIIEIATLHLIESMSNGKVEMINNDKAFSILYHTPVPARRIEEGATILKTLRPGLKIGNKVLVRAQVSVENNVSD